MNCARSWLSTVPAVALATLAWVQPALAQDAGAPAGTGGITMDQFVARQSARIMAADSDGDGRVSRAEFAALANMRAGKAGRDPERLFDRMDSNHDGYLDKDEIRSVLEKRFRRMDLNGDGILTPEERMAGRPQRHQPESATMAPAAQP